MAGMKRLLGEVMMGSSSWLLNGFGYQSKISPVCRS